MVAFVNPPDRGFPGKYPAPGVLATQRVLMSLAVCLHGWIRRSRLSAGHAKRCDAHRGRVTREAPLAPPPAYVGEL